jgi:hypothetical protein
VNGDGVFRLIEEDAMIRDAQAEESLQLSTKRLDRVDAGIGIAVNGFDYIQGGFCSMETRETRDSDDNSPILEESGSNVTV